MGGWRWGCRMIRLKEKIKSWMGPLWWYAVVMFIVQRIGDVMNIYTGLWLIPKWVPQEQLGALLPLGQIGSLLGLPLAITLMPFTKFINTFGAKGEYGKVKALLFDALLLTGASSFVIGAYTWVSAPHVFDRLRIDQTGIVWLLCVLSVFSVMMPLLNSALQALKQFRCISVIGLVSAPVRLAVLFVMLPLSGLFGYFAAQVMLCVVSIGIAIRGLTIALSGTTRRESYSVHFREMLLYVLPVAMFMAVGSLSTTVQFFIIRQRLPDVESAAFYFGSRFSEIPNMLWSSVAIIYFPVVSEAFEKGKNTSRMLVQTLVVTVLGGGVVAICLGFGVEQFFGMVAKWRSYQPYAYLVFWMAMTNVFRVAYACFSMHEMACRRFGFLFCFLPLALLESGALVALTGYTFFEPYVPASWIGWMASLRAARLEFIVVFMLCVAGLQFLGILVQMSARSLAGRATGCQDGCPATPPEEKEPM